MSDSKKVKRGKSKIKRSAIVAKRTTLQNKIARLDRQLRKSPGDISADIARSQALYDLSKT